MSSTEEARLIRSAVRCRYSHGYLGLVFFFSSRRRHTRFDCDWISDVCSSDLLLLQRGPVPGGKASFGGNVQFRSGDPSPTGNVRYLDHVTSDDIKATSFITLVIGAGLCGPDTHALIIGKATVNGVPDQDLQINVDDCSEPGSQLPGTPDVLTIMTGPTQVYLNGGPLVG